MASQSRGSEPTEPHLDSEVSSTDSDVFGTEVVTSPPQELALAADEYQRLETEAMERALHEFESTSGGGYDNYIRFCSSMRFVMAAFGRHIDEHSWPVESRREAGHLVEVLDRFAEAYERCTHVAEEEADELFELAEEFRHIDADLSDARGAMRKILGLPESPVSSTAPA